MAYCIWVCTWLMWLDCAPELDMMVVSEIGEIWSPQTAPASTAATATIIMLGSVSLNILTTMGTRMANVPQLVPEENAMKMAMQKINSGTNRISPAFRLTAWRTIADTQRVSHAFQRPSQHQNQDSGHHQLAALGHRVHEILEPDDPARQIEHQQEPHRDKPRKDQRLRRGAVGEILHKVRAAVQVAGQIIAPMAVAIITIIGAIRSMTLPLAYCRPLWGRVSPGFGMPPRPR